MLSPQVLQSYRELFGIAPERHYTDAQCDEYVEQYVHMMHSRTHFTENVAFNIVYDGRMKLVVCVSTPASTANQHVSQCHGYFYRILAPQVWSQEEWYRIRDKGRSCGVHKDMQRRSSSLCNSQCHGYLLSKRTIGRVSAQVESDSPSCILHYDIVMSSTKAMLCNLRLQT